MRPEVHWIYLPASARLAIMARPRAGDWLDDDIAGWREEGIGVIVSLLEAGKVEELGLHREAGLCHDHDMEFISFRAWVNARGDGPRRDDSYAAERGESRRRSLQSRDRTVIAHRGMRPRALGLCSGNGIRSHRKGAGRQGPGYRRTRSEE